MKNTYILDTNILVHLIRRAAFKDFLIKRYNQVLPDNIISVVSQGEILSLSLQLNWGIIKQQRVLQLLNDIIIYPIRNKEILQAYAQIDAYSQGKLLHQPLPDGLSARNMGKNDLWIAATAHVLDAVLITTDKDFDHLDGQFIQLDRIIFSELG